MNTKARLIYKSPNTCFTTCLPVYFYGMSSGKMVVLFSQFKNNIPFDTAQEWVMAYHNDFEYDYDTDAILTLDMEKVDIEEFMELADNLEQRITPVKSFGTFYSNNEAQQYFNVNLSQMLGSLKNVKSEINYYYTDWQL